MSTVEAAVEPGTAEKRGFTGGELPRPSRVGLLLPRDGVGLTKAERLELANKVRLSAEGRMKRRLGYPPWSAKGKVCVSPLHSVLTPRLRGPDFRLIASDNELQQAEVLRCRHDPWYWCVNYLVTQDEHWQSKGLHGPYQRWPATRDIQSRCYELWKFPMLALPKGRQRKVTWNVSGWLLGDALWTGGRLYMIQSKGERDAVKVLGRIRGMYARLRQLAPWMAPKLKKDKDTEIQLANGSTMMAVPEGPHYVQSHTPSWWFCDEAQKQENVMEAFYQALPACEHITMVGTPDYGWFYQGLLTQGGE